MTSPRIQLSMLDSPTERQCQLGSLLLKQGSKSISLPLGSVDVKARVVDRVCQVTLKQVFRNNLSEPMEAVYIFPLAPASAIFSFNMKVGERLVKGLVQERAEARQSYQQAVQDGKRAALLEQERDDVFTVQVGNLPPGEEVTIELSYSERLSFFENGTTELRLPLVVAPRYIPGGALDRESVGDGTELDTDQVPDASRITPPRLAPGVDPQTALKLMVEILELEGSQLSDLSCSQHALKTGFSENGITVSLARVDERLNRDFVLRWRSCKENVKTSLVAYSAPDGQAYGLLSILPPRRAGYLGAARDIVFVVDRSGSMQGVKMSSAARACSILLNTLGPRDRFAIASFDHSVDWMPSSDIAHFLEADTAGIEAGEKYLRAIVARGGTELDTALRSAIDALNNRSNQDGRLPTIVLLTDGEVGNETQILQRIQREIREARLFTVGIDTAVNSGLLKRLAKLGGGTAAFVEPGIQLEEALTSIAREIGAPLVTDLQVENLDLTVDRASFSPSRIPDVFAGRASVCFFKLSGKGKLVVRGKLANGKNFEEKVKAQFVDMPAISQLWAKAHIVDLEDQYRISPATRGALKNQIVDIAVKHSLLTKFTAFVVVDDAEIVNKTGNLQKVVQPVEVPQAWELFKDAWAGSPAQAPAMPGSSAGIFDSLQSGAHGFRLKHLARPALSNQPAPANFQPAPPSAPPPAAAWDSLATSPVGGSWGADSADSWAAPEPFSAPVAPLPAVPSTGSAAPLKLSPLAEEIDRFGSMRNSKKQNAAVLRGEVSRLKPVLLAFFAAFEEAFNLLSRGSMPDPSLLESARVNLLQGLAPTVLGVELPCLQRFLRRTGVELFSSLKDKSITVKELQEFWLSKKNIFEELRREMDDFLSGTEAAFWESSV